MAPEQAKDTKAHDTLPVQICPHDNYDVTSEGLPVSDPAQATTECAYRTLIRLDNSSN